MSEDVARAVGAGQLEPLVIEGITCKIRPLSIRELAEIERECLSLYRKSYLSTFAENIEMLGERGPAVLQEKMEEAGRWDVNDLPHKSVYDASSVHLTDKLIQWLRSDYGFKDETLPEGKRERMARQMVVTALDADLLTEAGYEMMTGHKPKKAKVGYVNWWTTGTYDGMISMVWTCFKDNPGLTRDMVAKQIGTNPQLLIHASREIENLTAPALGNG